MCLDLTYKSDGSFSDGTARGKQWANDESLSLALSLAWKAGRIQKREIGFHLQNSFGTCSSVWNLFFCFGTCSSVPICNTLPEQACIKFLESMRQMAS